MNIYSIYKITNKINNKSYIGFTNKTPQERYKTHIQSAFTRNSQHYIHRAIRKYGIDNFILEIIFQSHDGKYLLNEAEQHFINEFNTHCIDGYGYNMTYGGQGSLGRVFTNETKRKISTANKGKTKGKSKSESQKRKMSIAASKRKPPIVRQSTRDKLSKISIERNSKTWIILCPDGEKKKIVGLKRFCKEKNINYNRLYHGKTINGYKVISRDQ